jgi:hypothetical protein
MVAEEIKRFVEEHKPTGNMYEGASVPDFVRDRILERFKNVHGVHLDLTRWEWIWTMDSPFGVDVKLVGSDGQDSGFRIFDVWLVHYFKDLCDRSKRINDNWNVDIYIRAAVELIIDLRALEADVFKRGFLESEFGSAVGVEIFEEVLGKRPVVYDMSFIPTFVRKVILGWIDRYITGRVIDRIGLGIKFETENRWAIGLMVSFFPDWFKNFPNLLRHPYLIQSLDVYSIDGNMVSIWIKTLNEKDGKLWSSSGYIAGYPDTLVNQIIANAENSERLIGFFNDLKRFIDVRIANLRSVLYSGCFKIKLK